MSILSDEQQILALHEAGDRALMSADLAGLGAVALSRGIATTSAQSA